MSDTTTIETPETGTPPPRPPWWRRKLILIPIAGLALVSAGAIGAVAASGSHPAAQPSVSRTPPSGALASPSTAPASASCTTQFDTWRSSPGAQAIGAIGTDLGNMQPAAEALATAIGGSGDLSSAESGLSTAAAKLQADVTTAQSNLAPSCVPNMGTDESAALTDLDQSAIDANNAVGAVQSGDYSTADDDITAANQAMVNGGNKLGTATNDLKAWEGTS
jgi:hypothetical protein